MHPILLRVQSFLTRAQTDGTDIDAALVSELGAAAVQAVTRSFTSNKRSFTLRASNIGRPSCMLHLESKGTPKEQPSYNNKMRFLIGDLTEQYAILILKASGVNIESIGGEVELGGLIGHYDVVIDGKIWDIKSASDWSFRNKMNSFESIQNGDTFGYIAQGVFYQVGLGKPFGGWIVINKSSGEWNVIEFPHDDKAIIDKALDTISETRAIIAGTSPPKFFEDEEETFYKKKTGNRLLNNTCGFCDFKQHCFPGVRYAANPSSKAKNPPKEYYTVLVEGAANVN